MTFETRWLARLLAWTVAAALAGPAAAQSPSFGLPPAIDARGIASTGFDAVHTRFGFELRTRWGQQVQGLFPSHDGALVRLPDGRNQVHIQLRTGDVVVEDSERYTAIARGERFFDAARYPLIEFVSEPHLAALAHEGGQLRGRLTLHGVSRIETFTVAAATCARPGIDCDVVAHGSVDRRDYGLDGWRWALTDTVRFNMRVRLQDRLRERVEDRLQDRTR